MDKKGSGVRSICVVVIVVERSAWNGEAEADRSPSELLLGLENASQHWRLEGLLIFVLNNVLNSSINTEKMAAMLLYLATSKVKLSLQSIWNERRIESVTLPRWSTNCRTDAPPRCTLEFYGVIDSFPLNRFLPLKRTPLTFSPYLHIFTKGNNYCTYTANLSLAVNMTQFHPISRVLC